MCYSIFQISLLFIDFSFFFTTPFILILIVYGNYLASYGAARTNGRAAAEILGLAAGQSLAS